jgi:opacity protein-like surface antigen
MTYVTLGAAYGETDTTLAVAAGGVTNTLNASSVSGGWTWGTGIEAALDGNWTAKAEYLYVTSARLREPLGVSDSTPETSNEYIAAA